MPEFDLVLLDEHSEGIKAYRLSNWINTDKERGILVYSNLCVCVCVYHLQINC